MQIKKEIYNKMLYSIPLVPPETGGILGMKDGVITQVCFDNSNLQNDRALYIPNIKKLNNQIMVWDEKDITFAGIFHSHMPNQEELSQNDFVYINDVMRAMPDYVKELYFPVVIPKNKIISYKARNQNHKLVFETDIIKIL